MSASSDFSLEVIVSIQDSDATLEHHRYDGEDNLISSETISEKSLPVTIKVERTRAILAINLLLGELACCCIPPAPSWDGHK